ncbi:MAG: hypothetical protein R3253_06995 [Longimicrobiales bacterium]|nr:hypothetical protein [Longimicrobiales bacterium]
MSYVVSTALGPSLSVPLAAAVPTDPPALAAYTLLAWFVLLVWLGNRGSGKKEGASDEQSPDHASAEAPPAEGEEDGKRATGARTGASEAHAAGSEGRTTRRKTKKLSRKQRRRRGHINWIQ